MKKTILLLTLIIFNLSCKKSNRILLHGLLKDKENYKIIINGEKIKDEKFLSTAMSKKLSWIDGYSLFGEIIDYSFYFDEISFRVILTNEQNVVIDTLINRNQNELPFLIYFEVENDTTFNSKILANKKIKNRYIKIVDKNDGQEYHNWKMFFDKYY